MHTFPKREWSETRKTHLFICHIKSNRFHIGFRHANMIDRHIKLLLMSRVLTHSYGVLAILSEDPTVRNTRLLIDAISVNLQGLQCRMNNRTT